VLMLVMGVGAMQAEEIKTVTVKGMVNVTEDDDGNITGVLLKGDFEAYTIVLDEKGLRLGGEMDGEQVEVTGVIAEQGGKKFLTVKSFKAVVEEEIAED